MLGFKHTAIYIHRDDSNNPRVIVSLYSRYRNNGIYKVSKSYRAVAGTPATRNKMAHHIEYLIVQAGEIAGHNSRTMAMYSQWESKGFYLSFLEEYAKAVIEFSDEYEFITRTDKKVEYLLKKLEKIEPNFLKSIAPEEIAF